jgi:acyl CoA:acetate/3-ketoacid CoA transferase beta subunit
VAEGGAVRDEKGGLFHAKNGKGNAQVGRTFIARRIPGMDGASDVAVEQGRCYVLLADNAQKKGRIVATSDLRKWDEIYAGQFDASPISLGVISQTCYVGLADGTIAMILTGK